MLVLLSAIELADRLSVAAGSSQDEHWVLRRDDALDAALVLRMLVAELGHQADPLIAEVLDGQSAVRVRQA